jgi:thiol-disulfide isomerase/thioredoxin
MEESAQPARTSAGPRFLVDFLSDPRRWGVLVAVVLSAGAIWAGLSAVPTQGVAGGATSAPREGFLAPDFRLTLLGGGEVALSELRGQVVIVNLWASWCPPCRAEMPALQEAYEAYHHLGLEILAVNTTYQDSQAAAAGFVQEYGLTFPVPLDQTGEVSRSYLLRALPTSFFIDRDGVIQTVVIGGPMSRTTIRTTVEQLLDDE